MSGPGNETPVTPPKAPPTTPPGQPAKSSGGGSASATTTVTNAVAIVRERLLAGEQLVLTAAAVIVLIVYLLFQFLLDYPIVSDFTVVMAVLTILAIWIHRWGHYDFGNGYRIVIGALGLSLALFAVINFLAWVRVGGDSAGFLHLIGRIIFWVSGIAAGYGAWLVFRLRED
jgi:hypothetical protein